MTEAIHIQKEVPTANFSTSGEIFSRSIDIYANSVI